MFSNFGSIFNIRPRHAENTDARLDIRRHDPDQERRRKKDSEVQNNPGFETDDNATVTVEALRVFLLNFLESLQAPATGAATSAKISPEAETHVPETPAHTDGEAAKAADAYRHAAQKKHHAPVTPPPAQAAPAIELAADDVRAIHRLLADLGPLAERGIEYLTIERGKSFLASLTAAVEKAKNS
ncbi:MAG: hypothetical protein WBK55_06785 [Alphaproteobacteria bacterium]